MISFALSGILFLVVYTVAVGYSVDVQVERRSETDIRIRHKGTIWNLEEAYQPVSPGLVERLEKLDFAEDFRVCYLARTRPDYSIWNGVYLYEPSRGEIAMDGEVARDMTAYRAKLAEEQENDYIIEDGVSVRGNCRIGIAGIDPEYLDAEGRYYIVLEGRLDPDRFAEGDYLIYNRSSYISDLDQSRGMEYQVHAGDQVKVSFYDDVADRYVQKQFTVMALVVCSDPFGNTNTETGNIWITADVFKDIYSDHESLVGSICFNAPGREKSEAVQKILEDDGNLQLQLDSRWQTRVYYTQNKKMITFFGMLLALIVGLIGIANMINTVTTNVLVRRVEYAAMQAVGMTGRQMRRDIFGRYAAYAFLSLAIAAVSGGAISYITGANPAFNFSIGAFGQALSILFAFSVFLCLVMSRLLTRAMTRRSVVERLRDSV